MNRIMRFFVVCGIVYICICLVIFPKEGINATSNAVMVCINSVIPALFPYLVCSGYLCASGFASMFSRYLSPFMKPIFGVPGCGAVALVLGMVSGYPVGAACAADLYASGQCSKRDAEKLLAFCNNSGPVFVMSMVGAGMLQSPHIGRLLYISHILAAVLTGIIMRTYSGGTGYVQKTLPTPICPNAKNTLCIFGNVMDNSVFSILKICGFVIFFSVFAASLPATALYPYIHGFLEITGGVRAIAGINMDFELKLSLISFFLAFSGISVLFQVGAIAAKYGLSLKPYAVGKLLQAVFSSVLTKIMVSKLPQTVDVFAQNGQKIIPTALDSLTVSVFMLGIGVLLLCLFVGAAALWRRIKL